MRDSTFRPVGALVKSVPASAAADPGGDTDKATLSWQLTVSADIAAHTRVALEDSWCSLRGNHRQSQAPRGRPGAHDNIKRP